MEQKDFLLKALVRINEISHSDKIDYSKSDLEVFRDALFEVSQIAWGAVNASKFLDTLYAHGESY